MAASPSFAATPNIGVASVSVANTARDGSGTLATVLVGAATGTKIDIIRVIPNGDPTDSIVNLFLHDGTTAWFFASVDIGNPSAPSATVDVTPYELTFPLLVLKNASWSLRASITVAPTLGSVNVFALGGDF